ncbi:hypothetical protein Tsubulata_017846 [Turnera subulata]|uniref:Maternal effect embryo arrest 59 n=1 Tax=Turnera subulata TaxID=218843 RepID=A0A9Q0JQ27_9ROSI|nr:hypothetical protein Tsubulata_017846 [Turnera subulata]
MPNFYLQTTTVVPVFTQKKKEEGEEESAMEVIQKRPNRSDIHLSRDEEAKIEQETKSYFDAIAPKRHTKPQRSEYSTKYVDTLYTTTTNVDQNIIPEYVEFQRLEHDPEMQKLNCSAKGESEEFVETEYYKDLNCVDKQHHTTGTGFIRMEDGNGNNFSLAPDLVPEFHAPSKGNPATNDWIPVASNSVAFASDKPKRSDN